MSKNPKNRGFNEDLPGDEDELNQGAQDRHHDDMGPDDVEDEITEEVVTRRRRRSNKSSRDDDDNEYEDGEDDNDKKNKKIVYIAVAAAILASGLWWSGYAAKGYHMIMGGEDPAPTVAHKSPRPHLASRTPHKQPIPDQDQAAFGDGDTPAEANPQLEQSDSQESIPAPRGRRRTTSSARNSVPNNTMGTVDVAGTSPSDIPLSQRAQEMPGSEAPEAFPTNTRRIHPPIPSAGGLGSGQGSSDPDQIPAKIASAQQPSNQEVMNKLNTVLEHLDDLNKKIASLEEKSKNAANNDGISSVNGKLDAINGRLNDEEASMASLKDAILQPKKASNLHKSDDDSASDDDTPVITTPHKSKKHDAQTKKMALHALRGYLLIGVSEGDNPSSVFIRTPGGTVMKNLNDDLGSDAGVIKQIKMSGKSWEVITTKGIIPAG